MICNLPPIGWFCSRKHQHSGPCAAHPTDDVKHLSLDFWGTIASPNPEYTEARQEMLYKHFPEADPRIIDANFTHVKSLFDSQAEEFGKAVTSHQAWDILAVWVGIEHAAQDICRQAQQLFYDHPPLIPHYIKDALRNWVASGNTLSIASNINFISAETMRRVIAKELPNLFSFEVFSDESGCSKPSNDFFDKCTQKALTKSVANIDFHIGDSIKCDGGSTLVGIPYLHTTGLQHTGAIIAQLLKDRNK